MNSKRITRRSFLLQSSLLSLSGLVLGGSAIGLEEKTHSKEILFVDSNNIDRFFKPEQLAILSKLVDTLIPKTDTPSASEIEVHLTLDEWMTGWASKKTKDQFLFLIANVEREALKKFGGGYSSISEGDRFELTEALDKRSFDEKAKNTPEASAYRHFKNLVFHIYYTSEEVNPDYVLIPGSYNGCIDEKELKGLVGN